MFNISLTYRFVAVFMALLMTSISLGSHLSVHKCNGEIQTFSFIDITDPCEMASKRESVPDKSKCPHHQRRSEHKNCCHKASSKDVSSGQHSISDDCCKDELIVADVSVADQQFERDTLGLSQSFFVPLFFIAGYSQMLTSGINWEIPPPYTTYQIPKHPVYICIQQFRC